MISGRSGLGPMKDMSPFKMFTSWGSSSSLHLRMNFPTGVTRSSFFWASLATPSFSASVRMLRNFMMWNSLWSWVHRTCLYSMGPWS